MSKIEHKKEEENLRQRDAAILHKRIIWISNKTSWPHNLFAYKFKRGCFKRESSGEEPFKPLVGYIQFIHNLILQKIFMHTPQNISFILSQYYFQIDICSRASHLSLIY